MPEDGSTHVKGKQAKPGMMLPFLITSLRTVITPVPLTLWFQICRVHRNKCQPLPMKTVTVFPLLQPSQSSRT